MQSELMVTGSLRRADRADHGSRAAAAANSGSPEESAPRRRRPRCHARPSRRATRVRSNKRKNERATGREEGSKRTASAVAAAEADHFGPVVVVVVVVAAPLSIAVVAVVVGAVLGAAWMDQFFMKKEAFQLNSCSICSSTSRPLRSVQSGSALPPPLLLNLLLLQAKTRARALLCFACAARHPPNPTQPNVLVLRRMRCCSLCLTFTQAKGLYI